MSNYSPVTNFLSKDSLVSGNPLKAVKGADFTTEFTAVQTAVNSKQDAVASGTFTATATGLASGTSTGTAFYRIIGNICTLYVPLFNGISNAVTFTCTGLPALLQPATVPGQAFAMTATDNSVSAGSASMLIAPGSGTITFLNNNSSNGWTASGSKTGGNSTVTYLLD